MLYLVYTMTLFANYCHFEYYILHPYYYFFLVLVTGGTYQIVLISDLTLVAFVFYDSHCDFDIDQQSAYFVAVFCVSCPCTGVFIDLVSIYSLYVVARFVLCGAANSDNQTYMATAIVSAKGSYIIGYTISSMYQMNIVYPKMCLILSLGPTSVFRSGAIIA